MTFNFETAAFWEPDTNVEYTEDNCKFPAFKIPYSELIPTSNCRCEGHRNFSVLMKFAFNHQDEAVELLSLGDLNGQPQFMLSYDNCEKQFNLSLNEQCGDDVKQNHYKFTLDEVLNADQWYKFAFEISETSVTLFMECDFLNPIAKFDINRTDCYLKCDTDSNKLLGKLKGSTCSTDSSSKVCIYNLTHTHTLLLIVIQICYR